MNKGFLIPTPLKAGDKAMIVSPSGNIEHKYIDGARLTLQGWGLEVEVAPHAYEAYGRFGGTLEERLSDLQQAMDNKDVKLILCSRGGYGTVHLLEKLNFSAFKQSPKWLVGYSDITALQMALFRQGIASLHAPMARHLSENNRDEAALLLQEILFGQKQEYKITAHPLNIEGKVSGQLFGGNLAVMTGLSGTSYMQIPDGCILFVEDISESAYKIDRMMWNLHLSGVLTRLSGLIVGRFADCEEDPLMGATIYENIRQLVVPYNYPVIFDFPVGHIEENYPLVQGGLYELSVETNGVVLNLNNNNKN